MWLFMDWIPWNPFISLVGRNTELRLTLFIVAELEYLINFQVYNFLLRYRLQVNGCSCDQ
jgi:hypothetical protein